MSKILQVLDPSHADWVLGGIFSDLRRSSDFFVNEPIFLPPPNSIQNLFVWIFQSLRISYTDFILFSSLTSLENYGRFPFRRKSQVLGVWFTHHQFDFTSAEEKMLSSCKFIFVHSEKTRSELKEKFSGAAVIRIVGAIDTDRFREPAVLGSTVVWVGSATLRKNPQYLVDLAKAAPDLKFKVLGKDWLSSEYWTKINDLHNIEYVEITGALSSTDFNDCGVYLMLSEIEGGPMPLLESLAAGLVPICARTGFVEDLLEPLNLHSNIVDGFDVEKILKLIKIVLNSSSYNKTRTDFAKSFDFNRLSIAIASAYYG